MAKREKEETPVESTPRGVLGSYYSKRIDSIDKKLRIRAGTEHLVDVVTTGNLCQDWVLGGGVRAVFNSTAGFEQSAKCICFDHVVNTNEGFLDIGELVAGKDFTRVRGMTVTTHEGIQKVSHTYRGRGETIKVTTKRGFEIEGTHEHPILVLDQNLDYTWKRLDELTTEDYIVASGRNVEPQYGSNTDCSLDMATVLGYMVANGHGDCLSSTDSDVINRFRRAVYEITGRYPTGKNNAACPSHCLPGSGVNGANCPTGSRWTFRKKYLQPLGYSARKAKEKSIPIAVRTAPQEILHEFLEAYFECDSGVDGGVIELISASKKLIRQLHVILAQAYGIIGTRTSLRAKAHNSRKPKERTYYQIALSGDDAQRFLDTFKRAKVQKYRDRFFGDKKHAGGTLYCVVPHVRKATMDAYAKAKVGTHGGDTRVTNVRGEILRNYWKPDYSNLAKSGYTGNHFASEYLFNMVDWDTFVPHLSEIDPTLARKLKIIYDNAFTYEKVVSIEAKDKRKKVYDLTVPGNHAFVANGLVSHNTTTEINILGQCIKAGVPLVEMIDAEGALDPNYADKLLAHLGLKADRLFDDETRRYYSLNVLEEATAQIARLVRTMPDKIWSDEADSWCYVLEKGLPASTPILDALKQAGLKPEKKLSDSHWWVPTDYTGPEAALFLDSWPSLIPEGVDENIEKENDKGAGLAALARSMSEELPKFAGRLKRKAVLFWSINQLREAPMQLPPVKEAAGNALKMYSMVRNQMHVRSVPPGFDKDPEAGNLCIEESIEGEGHDRYAFKAFNNVKNKFSRPFLKTMVRVWTSDTRGNAHGLDPVYDTFQYLKHTGQLKGSYKKGFTLKLKSSVTGRARQLDGFAFDGKIGEGWMKFKRLILAEYFNDREKLKEVLGDLGLSKPPKLREALFNQVKSDPDLWGENTSVEEEE